MRARPEMKSAMRSQGLRPLSISEIRFLEEREPKSNPEQSYYEAGFEEAGEREGEALRSLMGGEVQVGDGNED